jgi:hypothetical protein
VHGIPYALADADADKVKHPCQCLEVAWLRTLEGTAHGWAANVQLVCHVLIGAVFQAILGDTREVGEGIAG